MATQQIERSGVYRAADIFNHHGWLFREQSVQDYGIDAHVEIVESDDYPSGKLIALQIKAGKSFFKEHSKDGFVFRPEEKHIDYWLNHTMPVVLLLFNPESEQLYWQHVSRDTLIPTAKGGQKIIVPEHHILDREHALPKAFQELWQPEPYIRRLNRLRLDRAWMQMLRDGEKVVMEFDDWVNKSLKRFKVKISGGGKSEAWPTVYAPGRGIADVLEHYIPWADYDSDEELWREYQYSIWDATCYAGRDPETGETYYSETFDDWYQPPKEKLLGVPDGGGEVRSYRLILRLNDFGEAFLELDEFLEQEAPLEKGTFTDTQLLEAASIVQPAAKPAAAAEPAAAAAPATPSAIRFRMRNR